MKIIENNIDFYINKLKNKEYFSFTRWGDGEWSCVLGVSGQNCDGHEYFPEMRDGLANALLDNKGYYLASWPLTVRMFSKLGPTIKRTVNENKLGDFVDARVWENAAMAGTLQPLITQLKNMNFIMVSDGNKRSLSFVTDFIEIPSKNCFLEKETIKQQMREMTKKYNNVVFGLSASMASNVIIDELYNELGKKCWMIDFGSIWEPYVGNINRTYHKQYKTINYD